MHQQQFKNTQQVGNHYYSILPANIYKAKDCPIYKSKKPELRKRATQQKIPHKNIY